MCDLICLVAAVLPASRLTLAGNIIWCEDTAAALLDIAPTLGHQPGLWKGVCFIMLVLDSFWSHHLAEAELYVLTPNA